MKNIIAIYFLLLSTVAFADQFTRFDYKEKGFVGGMIVLNERTEDIPVKPIVVSIHTGNIKTHHMCELRALENTSARIGSDDSLSVTMQVMDDDKNLTGETFDMVFQKSSASITINSPSSYCGISATFSGLWQRTRKLKHW